VVTIENLNFSYGSQKIFKNLNLELQGGNIYGLLGRNGAGKSTLLKLISGQLFPQSGEITTTGYSPCKRHPGMLRELFYLPEEFLLPQLTVNQYVRLNAPFYPRFSRHQFNSCLNEFELDPAKKISDYSYGQKKKFLLAFGLASNTSIFILDEPTNGLDIPSKSQFRRTLASAIDDSRMFIISTHQVRDMHNLIDPLVIVDQGQIIFNQRLDDVSKKLTHSIIKNEPSSDFIFSEKVPNGYSVVTRRKSGEDESGIDLETLFNTAVANPDLLKSLFSEGVRL